MKVRLGFVSNSSSASYYVTLTGDPTTLLNEIAESCDFPYLSSERMLNQIDKVLERLENRLADLDSKKETFLLLDTKPELEEKIKQYKEYKKVVGDIFASRSYNNWDYRANELVQIAFNLNYISCTMKEDKLFLEQTTAMHNSYCDGMVDFLKDIVLYYSFERPAIISLRVDHRG